PRCRYGGRALSPPPPGGGRTPPRKNNGGPRPPGFSGAPPPSPPPPPRASGEGDLAQNARAARPRDRRHFPGRTASATASRSDKRQCRPERRRKPKEHFPSASQPVDPMTFSQIILALHFRKARGGAAEGVGAVAGRIKLVGRSGGGTDQL